jgi:hypothetical protein
VPDQHRGVDRGQRRDRDEQRKCVAGERSERTGNEIGGRRLAAGELGQPEPMEQRRIRRDIKRGDEQQAHQQRAQDGRTAAASSAEM